MNYVLVTVTNLGYKSFTHNALLSLQKTGFDLSRIHLYTMDLESKQFFRELFPQIQSFQLDYVNSELAAYKKDHWNNVTMQKIVAVSKEMMEPNVDAIILFDGDIFFESIEAIEYCVDQMRQEHNLDLLAQHEWKDNSGTEICSGFYIIRCNTKTKNEFSTMNIEKSRSNDQDFLNQAAKRLRWKLLPVEKFPNGKAYYEKHSTNPWLIHFNFVFNTGKRQRMIGYKKWIV